VLQHPTYTFDFPLYDVFLFPKIRIFLKGSHFETREDIQINMMTIPRGLWKNTP